MFVEIACCLKYEFTLEFIRIYDKYPILWNAKHPGHRNKNTLNDAWQKVSSELSIQV